MRLIFASWFTLFNTWKYPSCKWHHVCINMKTSWHAVAGELAELIPYLAIEGVNTDAILCLWSLECDKRNPNFDLTYLTLLKEGVLRHLIRIGRCYSLLFLEELIFHQLL